MTCSLENLVSISFFASEHIFFCENVCFLDISHKKKWINSHNFHVIIFYLTYVYHLIENIFRTVSFSTLRTIEKLFFVLSYFKFYEMNFFDWNLMPWEAFIPKYLIFSRATRKQISAWQLSENLTGWKFVPLTRKIRENLGINTSHGFKFQ